MLLAIHRREHFYSYLHGVRWSSLHSATVFLNGAVHWILKVALRLVLRSAAIIRPPPPQALRMQGKPRSTYEAHKQQQLRPERLLQPWERRHRICVVGGKLGTATIEVKQNTSLAEAQGVAEATVAISDDEEYEGASESVFGWSRRRDRPFPQPGGRAINEEQWLRRAVWVTGLESTG